MDSHGVTNTGILWVLNSQKLRLQGVQLDYFYSKPTVLCGIGQIIGGGGVTGRYNLGLFLLVVEYGTPVSGTVGVISKQTQQKRSLNVCISFSMLFSKIRLG